MNIAEQFEAGDISYEDAVTLLVRARAEKLHEATSAMGSTPQKQGQRRISAYREADALHQQLKRVWYVQSTPPEFEKQLGSHRLQSSYKGSAVYRTPEHFRPDQVSHIALTADEKFARESIELLNLDNKMARIEALGLLSGVGE